MAEALDQPGEGVGLGLRRVVGGPTAAQITEPGGGDELEAVIGEWPDHFEPLVKAAAGSVDRKNGRALAAERVLDGAERALHDSAPPIQALAQGVHVLAVGGPDARAGEGDSA